MSDPVGPINHPRTRPLEMGEARDVSSVHARTETYSSTHILPESLVVSQRGPVTLVRLSRPARATPWTER